MPHRRTPNHLAVAAAPARRPRVSWAWPSPPCPACQAAARRRPGERQVGTRTTTALPFGAAAGSAPAHPGARLARPTGATPQAVRTRRQLAALDGRLLSDIGPGRADALREAGRAPRDTAPDPCW